MRNDSTNEHHQVVITEIRSIISFEQKMEKLHTVSKIRPGADCGSDYELLNAKFRLTLNKVGKTTRPYRHDLNQVPYGHIVEGTNGFKELNLIE